jgi:hypothetical protein
VKPIEPGDPVCEVSFVQGRKVTLSQFVPDYPPAFGCTHQFHVLQDLV